MNISQQIVQESYKSQLYKLIDVREAAGVTTTDMARSCGLYGNQSRKTVARWEQGYQVPRQRHRPKFIQYLWSTLQLWQNPEQFDELWEIVMMAWEWDPLTENERHSYLADVQRDWPHPNRGEAAPVPIADSTIGLTTGLTTASAINDTTHYSHRIPSMLGQPTLDNAIGKNTHHIYSWPSLTVSATSNKSMTIQIVETQNVVVIPVNSRDCAVPDIRD
ncbi:MAG: helix-turn-helix transcriptional regulator [Chloroflexota bacterium]